ncbi:hypothetical protein ACTMU2_11125 [Cupriavidus basilensis]
MARDTALSPDARHFSAAMATGFVMLNLLCNGLTLKRTLSCALGMATPDRPAPPAGQDEQRIHSPKREP